MTASDARPRIQSLVLDAGPLLSLAPLRGLAEQYFTCPQIIDELKDPRAREHFERLGLTAGVHVQIRQPTLLSLAEVTSCAKRTGDYSVLSHADLCVLALTHSLANQEDGLHSEPSDNARPLQATLSPDGDLDVIDIRDKVQALNLDESVIEEGTVGEHGAEEDAEYAVEEEPTSLYEDPDSEDDSEGDWITPANVSLHKSRAKDLLPSAAPETDERPMKAACMTGDFAVQNVLLHMGLDLVGMEGKRITTVKSWVLRCHACFKLCKDSTKKFCPSCGNPTLLRTSVTTQAPSSDSPNVAPQFTVHLKPNFQYRTRGTKYSIPLPKPGQAKGGGTGGSGLILREDQAEFQRAVRKEQGRAAKEERALARALAAAAEGKKLPGEGSWDDPDWIPGMLLGEGRKKGGGLPAVGHGRRNPNEVRRKK